jgi:hypothetical protein
MNEVKAQPETKDVAEQTAASKPEHGKKLPWETPKLEDVSEQVMAQPYIRFT